MPQLIFFTGPMDCGKSTLALQMDHAHAAGGRHGRRYTRQDRAGEAVISSRLGLRADAVEVGDDFDFWVDVVGQLTSGHRLDHLICDEAQFYTGEQVDQLAKITDELQLDVFAFGILSDFRTRLFPGSQRLVELADRIELLPTRPLCWCGQIATHTARTVDGEMVLEGSQVVVGDTADETPAAAGPEPVVAYEVLCRRHHRRRLSRQAAEQRYLPGSLLAEPLPFHPDTDQSDTNQ